MLYSEHEINISRTNLSVVAASVPSPLCLLGGWAVFLLTNKNFTKAHGREYHGSKDIDLGFYFNIQEDENSLKESLFNKSIIALKEIGFTPQSFRMVQIYHSEEMRPLTEEESKRVPAYNLFHFYVDLMVNRVPDKIRDVLGVTPADEPMITQIFEKKLYKTITAFGVDVLLPNPEIMLATKLNWVLQRTKDHKRIKDIADIYALIWYTDTNMKHLQKSVASLITQGKINKVLSSFRDNDLKCVSKEIGVNVDQIKSVFNNFIPESELKTMSSQNHDDDQRWRIPSGVSYNTLKIILTSIYQKQGDQKIISLNDIAKTSGITRKLVAANLIFFQSINLVKGTSRSGFQFTTLGTQFVKALIQKNDEEIKNMIRKIVSETYLQDIIEHIHVHDESISLSQLYGFIKAESRAPNGNTLGNMPPLYFTGVRALLSMLNTAELLPQNVSEELLSGSKDTNKSRAKSKADKSRAKSKADKSRAKSKADKSQNIQSAINDNIDLPTNVLGRVILKDIGHINIKDITTLDIARQYLDLLEKNISEPASEPLQT